MKYGIIIGLVLAVFLIAVFALKYDWSPKFIHDPNLDVQPFKGVSWNPLIDSTGHIYNQLGQQL